MKVLVTGFEPFGGEKVNPAFLAVKMLPDILHGATIIKREIPTAFYDSREVLQNYMRDEQPDLVFCIGQAGGRAGITVEKVAINLAEAGIPDNRGNQPEDEEIVESGPTAYFTNLPIKAIVNKIEQKGIAASVSYTAGTYVCNYIFYSLMDEIKNFYPNTRGGFIHVPYATEQGVGKSSSTPTMEVETISKAIKEAIITSIDYKEDLQINAGITH